MEDNAIFFRILIPVVSGISAGLLLVPSETVFASLLVACLLLFFLLLLFNKMYLRWQLYLYRWIPGFTTFIFLTIASAAVTIVRNPLYKRNHFSRVQTESIIIRVANQPKYSEKTTRFNAVAVAGIYKRKVSAVCGSLMVTVFNDKPRSLTYREGSYLLIPSVYSTVNSPLNPYEFNYKKYLASHGILHQVFLRGNRVKIIKDSTTTGIEAYANSLRTRMATRFKKFIADPQAAGIASALILGERADLSASVISAYSGAGVMHVLSVSGMHVALVLALLAYLLQIMDQNRTLKIAKAMIILAAVWFYALLTGLSPSVCRASVMISFVIVGKMLRRDTNLANSLTTSAVLLLLYDPYLLEDAGFQLSYLAVAGIAIFYPVIYSSINFRSDLARRIWACIAISVSAELATFPLTLYYFDQFPLYFLLGNLLITLPVMLIMYTGIVFLLIPVNGISIVLGFLLEKMILFVNKMLFAITLLPYSSIHGFRFGFWYYFLIYVAILFFFYAFKQQKKLFLYTALCVVLILFTANSVCWLVINEHKSILFYSLGRKNAIGLFNGRQAYVITDADRNSKTFSYSINPVIAARDLDLINCFPWEKSFDTGPVYSDGNFYAFAGRRILIADRSFAQKCFSRVTEVDFLLLTGNPRLNLYRLSRNIKYHYLIIAGDNSNRYIRQWRYDCQRLKIKCYVLKHNKAFEYKIQG